MSSKTPPDYELPDRLALTTPNQVRAISNPLRTTVLGLLHERAATVTELADAVGRPKSTVAHHVKVLAEAGLVRVVRTRRVRAVEERFYGRTARMFYVSAESGVGEPDLPGDFNDFEVAARESAAAFRDRKLWGFIRHARIPEERAAEFWDRDRRPRHRVRPPAQVRPDGLRLRRRHLPHGRSLTAGRGARRWARRAPTAGRARLTG